MYYFGGMILTVRHLYYCPFSGADIVSHTRKLGVRVLSVNSLAAIANGKLPKPGSFSFSKEKTETALTTTDSTEPPLFRYNVFLVKRNTPLALWQHHYKKKVHQDIKHEVKTD